jgi:trehalose 6-phosphate synthase
MGKDRTPVVVASRLPVRRIGTGKKAAWKTSPGGLVSAIRSLSEKGEIQWVGWTGAAGRAPRPFRHEGFHLFPVSLSAGDVRDFYQNFSNRTIWPLYHDSVRSPEYRRHWWQPYVEVNHRFAKAVAEVLPQGGMAWIQDYHLQLVPMMLRDLRPDARISFFLHIPFPPEELFSQIPWRRQIIEGLLGSDLIGFQSRLGARNFASVARRFTTAKGPDQELRFEGRKVRVAPIPISIDTGRFQELAATPEVTERAQDLRRTIGRDRRILLGVDRLDYTKGIDNRLVAFETLLENHPERVHDTVFIQVAVPSRERVQDYKQIRMEIEQHVGRINGAHGEPGLVPVQYMYRSLPQDVLVSHYLAADVMVVTPLRDGMNLVAKEYVASRLANTGSLVLSEFTGAALELRQSILVNPHDIDGLAASFQKALSLTYAESRRRMKALRRVVLNNDVFKWAERCLRIDDAS